ncbi:GNAT family N-acetyltransferase [Embleya sp. NBC_00896]|uniref:GNAT family N-acetyltransferase n=1 Tax=Embleya sp. NBC_00896 TaxID=2975961 RepID=UPI003865EE30|nr:GNAT family N-acetyltransferase [Embleya sp. NBC_00896]
MLTDYWPLFGLRVTTPRLELRVAGQDELFALVELAGRGVHDPDYMPFTTPWTRAPQPAMARNALKYFWSLWANWSPEEWQLMFAVVHDGEVVGVQECGAKDFAHRYEIGSGSWLGLAHQGKGFGTEMRAAMLELAFAGLGARWAVSSALLDNAPSLAVSRRLGYVDDGVQILAYEDGTPRPLQRLRLTREAWLEHRTIPAEIHGLDACRDMFGLADEPSRDAVTTTR